MTCDTKVEVSNVIAPGLAKTKSGQSQSSTSKPFHECDVIAWAEADNVSLTTSSLPTDKGSVSGEQNNYAGSESFLSFGKSKFADAPGRPKRVCISSLPSDAVTAVASRNVNDSVDFSQKIPNVKFIDMNACVKHGSDHT